MKANECYHCKQRIVKGTPHDCWTTTPERLTEHLPEPLLDAWRKLHTTADAFGEQRIYASHKSIMFSKKACYFFVRPTPKRLEVCVFLGRPLKHPLVRKAQPSSKTKFWNMIHVTHEDEVEAPLTDWLQEAFDKSDELTLKAKATKPVGPRRKVRKAATKKRATKKRPA